MHVETLQKFNKLENETWAALFAKLERCRKTQADSIFIEGLSILGIGADCIPDLGEVNKKLETLTGWKGVPVKGLEDGRAFFTGLKNKEFPIGNFLRSPEVLSYTPEPDIFHDLYGHIPFFFDKEYANFCQEFGERACKYLDDADKLLQFETLFWFTIEFGLIETGKGRRIFGGGILSSFAESDYALSDGPKVVDFDLDKIRKQTYRIDEMQPILFLLKNKKQLYGCLDEFEKRINS